MKTHPYIVDLVVVILASLTFTPLAGAEEAFPRGDINCSYARSAADLVAAIRGIGGDSICANDDCDRNGVVDADDVTCTHGCLFGPCAVPSNAPRITGIAPGSAADIVPYSAVSIQVDNAGAEEFTRATIAGSEAVVLGFSAPGVLEVTVPAAVPPGPAEVVVYDRDLQGAAFTTNVAPPVPVGQPDTFTDMLDLADIAVAQLQGLDIESAYPENAAVLREGLQSFRDELARQRAALESDPNVTPAVWAELDAAADASGAPELLRDLIIEIAQIPPAARSTGGAAADTAIVGVFNRGAKTIRVVGGVVAVAAGSSLSIPALAGIALAAGIVTGLVLVAGSTPATAPTLIALTFLDPAGAVSPHPSAAGIVRASGRFDVSNLVLKASASSTGSTYEFPGGPGPEGKADFYIPPGSSICGPVSLRLATREGLTGNGLRDQILPELVYRANDALKPFEQLGLVVRGFGTCTAYVIFEGQVADRSPFTPTGPGRGTTQVPNLPPYEVYNVWGSVYDLRSSSALDLQIVNAITGLDVSCKPAVLASAPGAPSLTKCVANVQPQYLGFPIGSVVHWASSNADALDLTSSYGANGEKADFSASRTAEVTVTAILKSPGANPLELGRGSASVRISDKTPPTVSLSGSSSELTPGSVLNVSVEASDNEELGAIEFTTTGDSISNPNPTLTTCAGRKTCDETVALDIKSSGFTDKKITVQAKAYDKSLNSRTSNTLTYSFVDNVCPTVTIDSPANGGSVNAGETVTVRAHATDNGPTDKGVKRFIYSASGAALTAPVFQDLPFPNPLPEPSLQFNLSIKSAADLAGVTDKTITIGVEAVDDAGNNCGAQTIAVTAVGTLDRCEGGIRAEPSSGYEGDVFTITVTLTGPVADEITRVTSINPLGQFDLFPQGGGVFAVTLMFQGKGAFTLHFFAYDAEGMERCSGSIGLEALGPRPESAATSVSAPRPAGARR